jgi:hypothetical protein
MSTFIQEVKQGAVDLKFTHILTGIELRKTVTLYPPLIPHGITIGNISSGCNKVPLYDLDHNKWMDLEISTIVSYRRV